MRCKLVYPSINQLHLSGSFHYTVTKYIDSTDDSNAIRSLQPTMSQKLNLRTEARKEGRSVDGRKEERKEGAKLKGRKHGRGLFRGPGGTVPFKI